MKQGGNRKDHAAEHGPSGAEEQAKQDNGFKGDVGGEKVGYLGSDPDAESEGHQKKPNRAAVWPWRRCSAKSRRWKVRDRARALATAAATPSLTSSVMSKSVSVTQSM